MQQYLKQALTLKLLPSSPSCNFHGLNFPWSALTGEGEWGFFVCLFSFAFGEGKQNQTLKLK